MAENEIRIHELADVHPSVILEGKITIGKYTRINAGTVIVGNVTIGDYCIIECNVAIRGRHTIGSWVHIYDSVCMEGGRPGSNLGGVTSVEPDRSIIGDRCWINHGATMHGAQLADGAVVDLNACLDYNCRIGEDAIVANGSACRANTVVPANCLYEGVPAKLVKENLTDDDRRALMGLVPAEWVKYAGELQAQQIRKKKGLPPEE